MQIGPYQLTRCLGQGGMGEVWLGKREAMGSAAKTVAIKLLRASDASARDNLVKEAKLAMLLRHSTIVQVNDVGQSNGLCFMEMEWVDGLDLSRLCERLRETGQSMGVGIAAYVTGELLKALAFAHTLDVDGKRESIVHRDVTPQNVLISKSGEVKLTDFGIAFLTSDKTSSSLIKGKSRYMSPEHVRQFREPCIDLFGVGAIFHEMVDGRKFRYTAQSDADLWSMAFAGEIPPLSVALPAELEELRRGLLAPDLADRLPSARAALAVLRRWPGYRDASLELEELVREINVGESPVTATTQQLSTIWTERGTPPPSSTASSSHRRHSILAVFLAIVGIGAFGAALLIDRNPGNTTDETPSVPPVLPAPEPTPEPEPEPEPEPVPDLPPPDLPPVTVVPESPLPAPTEDTPKAQKAKTRVTLTASGYPWVQIRIGSSTWELDRRSNPSKTISLRPGSYSAAFRIDDEDPWQGLGVVSIPARESARLVLQKPGKLIID